MFSPEPFKLTALHKLHDLVEQRTSFDTNQCQLNIFETHDKAEDFRLKFTGFTVTSMLRGKKLMHLDGHADFPYIPGETVIAPPDTLMRIDFPEAQLNNPTQCTALVVDNGYFQQQVAYINEKHGRFGELEWSVDPQKIYLKNSKELADLSTKLMKIFSDGHPFKDIYVDLTMKELVLCIIRLQYLDDLQNGRISGTVSPFGAVMEFIRKNISSDIDLAKLCRIAGMSKSSFYDSFTREFGISPKQLIIRERIAFSKQLLTRDGLSIKEACYAAGFSDPNYFIRIFKKTEGITPGALMSTTKF